MSSSNTFRTLIVVDVQNCFINGGSLGYADVQDTDPNGTNIFNDLKKHAKITQRIDKLYAEGNYDLNVFTKDSHPMNHSSHFKDLNPLKGLYFEHCVDCELARCKQRYVGYNFNRGSNKITVGQRITKLEEKTGKDILSTIDKHNYFKSVKDKPIKGIDFSYLFKFQPNLKSILEKEQQYEVIKAKKECLGSEFDLEKQSDNFKIYETSNKPSNILILRKGELCRYESYSAFNYHIYYVNEPSDKKPYLDPDENITKPIKDLKQKYSTGLFENILEKAIMKGSKTVEIDVCGLVTNICVINTIRQGIKMWEDIYSKKYKISVNFKLLDFASLPLQTDVFSNNNTVCDARTPNKDIFLKNLEQLRDDNNQDLLNLRKESFTIVTKLSSFLSSTKSSSRSSFSQSSNPLPGRPLSAQLPKSSSSQSSRSSSNPLPGRPSSAQLPKSSSSQSSRLPPTRLTGTTVGKKTTKKLTGK